MGAAAGLALVLALGSLVLGAPSGWALPTIAVRSPGPGEVVTATSTTIAAEVSSIGGKLTGHIRLTVDWAEGTQDQPLTPPPIPANGQQSQLVSFPVTLDRNGSYVATIEATDDGVAGGTGRTADYQFFVAAPPAPPSGAKAALGPGGKVAVSWNRNPEPDIVGYRVERNAGGGPFTAIGTTTETAFVDPGPPAGNGGYQVVALRRGARPGEEVASAPSSRVTVAGGGAKGGAPAPLDKADLTKFAKLLAEAKARVAAGQGEPGEDGTFDPDLPYARSAADEEELGSDDPIGSGRRTLPFVAAALLAADAFLFLRVIRSEAMRPPQPG